MTTDADVLIFIFDLYHTVLILGLLAIVVGLKAHPAATNIDFA
jgi:hypothetical protein